MPVLSLFEFTVTSTEVSFTQLPFGPSQNILRANVSFIARLYGNWELHRSPGPVHCLPSNSPAPRRPCMVECLPVSNIMLRHVEVRFRSPRSGFCLHGIFVYGIPGPAKCPESRYAPGYRGISGHIQGRCYMGSVSRPNAPPRAIPIPPRQIFLVCWRALSAASVVKETSSSCHTGRPLGLRSIRSIARAAGGF